MAMAVEALSIPEAFDRICLKNQHKTALIFDEETFTYQELAFFVNNLAVNLGRVGIKKNDRVALILSNRKEYIFAFFALFKLGAWVMPINTRWEEDEVRNVFEDARPTTVILEGRIGAIDFMGIIDNIRAQTDFLQNVIVVSGNEAETSANHTSNFRDLITDSKQNGVPAFDPVFPGDVAMLSYTSGTTGVPKGVMISHRNFYLTSLYCARLWRMREEIPLSIAPLYAAQGFLAMLIDFVSEIAMHFLSSFDPNSILKAASSEKNTVMHTQPTMWSLLLASRAIHFANFASFNKVVVSGSLCSSNLAEKIEQRVGCSLLNAYGLVEATSVVTLTRLEDSRDVRLNTVGSPIPGVAVRIVDDRRQSVPDGEVGELAVKGYLMDGYYNKPDQTKEVIDAEGWLYTGDLARFYDDRNISIVGRCKDMIIRGGFNIYPIDIEEVLLTHPLVLDAAVVGKNHEVIGEQTVAFMIPKAGSKLTENEILAYCKGKIANYKIPDHVVFISQMPIILSGKIQKNTLKKWVEEGVPETELFLFGGR
jgi:fatty-acyl-CoA synthase